jgi:uncharacterized membrane protein AbrB (regulator of aidB expression)
MPAYNPTEAKELVETLQKQAAAAVIQYTWYGAGLAILAVGWWRFTQGEITLAFFAAIPGGLIGYRLGYMRSLALKVQAQSLLCQIQIEENTRK